MSFPLFLLGFIAWTAFVFFAGNVRGYERGADDQRDLDLWLAKRTGR